LQEAPDAAALVTSHAVQQHLEDVVKGRPFYVTVRFDVLFDLGHETDGPTEYHRVDLLGRFIRSVLFIIIIIIIIIIQFFFIFMFILINKFGPAGRSQDVATACEGRPGEVGTDRLLGHVVVEETVDSLTGIRWEHVRPVMFERKVGL
jgi:hypothetical protein